MNLLLLNTSAGRARRVREGGRDYLVAPLTSIVPGVLSGSKGPLYYPEDEVSRNVGDWDGMPLTVYHPFDPATGAHLSASEPGVVERQGIGEVRKSTYNGRLRHEGWFDAERTRKVDPRVYDALVSGRRIELSTGLYTDNEVAPPNSHHNGRPYGHVARNYRPDHIAVLPDQTGACSVRDGCGVMVNEQGPTGNAVPQPTLLERFVGWLVGNAPSAGHPQVRATGGRFGSGPDLGALKRAVDASAQGRGPDGKGGPPLGPEDLEEGGEEDTKSKHGGGNDKSTVNTDTPTVNPFVSEDQRRYLWANEPDIAHKWAHGEHTSDSGHKMPDEEGGDVAGPVAEKNRKDKKDGEKSGKKGTENVATHNQFPPPAGGPSPVGVKPTVPQPPNPEAHGASKDAAVASVDHPPARDHAVKAMDFSKDGKPGLAAGRHDKAAEEHDAAATESRKGGDEAGAMDHEHAAMLHRKASSMHSLAVRNAKKREQDKGREDEEDDEDEVENTVKVYNKEFGSDDERRAAFAHMEGDSGPTGKAASASKTAMESGTKEDHSKAAKAHKAAAAHHESEGNDDKAETHMAAAKYHSRKGTRGGGTENMSRTETIDHLTTNCPCWKGGDDVLNLMSDRQLASVARNAKAEGSNADTTGKGGTVQAGGEEDEDDHETADDHTSEDLFTDKVKIKGGRMSENQFLASLPPSYREAVVNAQEITRRERVRLVGRLITNVHGDDNRRRIGARLMQKPLAELRDMLAMVPEPAYNSQGDGGFGPDNVPLYNGAGYGGDFDPAQNRGVSDDDVLPLPVTNFADISKEQRRQRQGV